MSQVVGGDLIANYVKTSNAFNNSPEYKQYRKVHDDFIARAGGFYQAVNNPAYSSEYREIVKSGENIRDNFFMKYLAEQRAFHPLTIEAPQLQQTQDIIQLNSRVPPQTNNFNLALPLLALLFLVVLL